MIKITKNSMKISWELLSIIFANEITNWKSWNSWNSWEIKF